MKDIKFIIAGDILVDMEFTQIPLQDNQKRIASLLANAPLQAFESLIDFAIFENIDFIIFTGQIVHSAHSESRIRLAIENGFRKLATKNTAIFLSCPLPENIIFHALELENIHIPVFPASESRHFSVNRNNELCASIYSFPCKNSESLGEMLKANKTGQENPVLRLGFAPIGATAKSCAAELSDVIKLAGLNAFFTDAQYPGSVWNTSPLLVSAGILCSRNPAQTAQNGCLYVHAHFDGVWSFASEFKDVSQLQVTETRISLDNAHTLPEFQEKTAEFLSQLQKNARSTTELLITKLGLTGKTELNSLLRGASPAAFLKDLLFHFSALNPPLIVPSIEVETAGTAEFVAMQGLPGEIARQCQELGSNPDGGQKLLSQLSLELGKMTGADDIPFLPDDHDSANLIHAAEYLCQNLLESE